MTRFKLRRKTKLFLKEFWPLLTVFAIYCVINLLLRIYVK